MNVLVPEPIESNFRNCLPDYARSGFEQFVVEQMPLERAGAAEEAAFADGALT